MVRRPPYPDLRRSLAANEPANAAVASPLDPGDHLQPPPRVAPALAAFHRGDYVEAQRVCRQVRDTTTDPLERRAAAALLMRVGPDPLARLTLALTALLLIALIVGAYSHMPVPLSK